MSGFISDARYWFYTYARTPQGKNYKPTNFPPYGGLAFQVNGATQLVELDYSTWGDLPKLENPGIPFAIGWRDRQTGLWRAEARRGLLATIYTAEHPDFSSAVEEVLRIQDQAKAVAATLKSDPIVHLEQELAKHDWWHTMSDSFSACAAGESHLKEILNIARQAPAEEVRKVWEKWAPKEFACPV